MKDTESEAAQPSRSVTEVRNCVKASESVGYTNSLGSRDSATSARTRCGISASQMEPKFLCLQGERQFDEQAAIRCVNSSYYTSMHSNNSLRDRQSKTGPIGTRFIG